MKRMKWLAIFMIAALLCCLELPGCNTNSQDEEDNNGQTSPYGSIEGVILAPDGSAVNAICVRAVKSDDTSVQIQHFSGIGDGLTINNGYYLIDFLPPGKYRVLVEALGKNSVTADRIDPFVSTNQPSFSFVDEYYNGSNESATDNAAEYVEVEVTAGKRTSGINFILNVI